MLTIWLTIGLIKAHMLGTCDLRCVSRRVLRLHIFQNYIYIVISKVYYISNVILRTKIILITYNNFTFL